MITGKNYIGNRQSAEGNTTYKTFNPQLSIENDTVFTEATSEEIVAAAYLASDAFEVYRQISGAKKAEFLNSVASEILALDELLIQTYCAETGLPEGRARGERGRTVNQLKLFADLVTEGSWVEATIDKAQPERQPMAKSDIRKMLIPIGPVVVFGASNFPLAFSTAGGDTVSALASGCPVIVKSHPMHSATGELVASAIIKAAQKTGMPNGVFSNLNGKSIEVGQKLVRHPKVKAVGFTGSFNAGKALFDLAAQREEPIPVFAEMGSVNPVVLLPETLNIKAEALAKTYAGSITLGTGQFCTNPGLLLGIKSESLSKFIQNLSEEILKIDPTSMLHPKIHEAYDRNKNTAISQNGIDVAADYSSEIKPNYAKQAIVTVDGATFLDNSTLHQEVFGPFSIVVQCESEKQLEEIILNMEGQLTGTVMAETNELSKYTKVIAALQDKVGRIIFNGVPTGVEVCPSMMHGGPFPASTDSRFTAIGVHAIKRWVRPFSYQDWPNELLPKALKDRNVLGINRYINGIQTKKDL